MMAVSSGEFSYKKEKTPSPKRGKEIFSKEISGQLVQLQGHAALFAGSSVLVQNPLLHSLVNKLDGGCVSSGGLLLAASGNSGLELLYNGLQLGLVGLVLLISSLGQLDSFLRGLDIGHGSHLLNLDSKAKFQFNPTQKSIIA